MEITELFFIAVGLSMDAFAVALCKGLATNRQSSGKAAVVVGLFFGGFQALMPLLGYLAGSVFQDKITAVAHWAAFILLCVIGVNMIRSSRKNDTDVDSSLKVGSLTVLALATSVDALAVGVTFAFLQVDIIPAILLIGFTTFCLSFAGLKVGCLFGSKLKSGAEIAGGVILILMGAKILLESFI